MDVIPDPTGTPQSPSEITKRSWRDIWRRTRLAASAQNISIIAAGIAFYWVWAFFPALVVLVILGGLLFGESEILRLISWIGIDLPESFDTVVVGQLNAIARHSRRFSGLTLTGSLAIALWSAMRGMRGLIKALNVIYEVEEQRGFWHRQALAFAFCCFGGGFLLIAIGLIVGMPPYISGSESKTAFIILAPSRWPILILALMISLSVLYRYGPSRRAAKWRWVSWGATASATTWVAGSFLFSYYASRYTRLNPLLGSLGAVTIFLLWSYLTVHVVLLGAQINAELERESKATR